MDFLPTILEPVTALPQPDTLPLPGPAWLLHLLLLFGFLLHVLAMNLALGGGVLAAASALRAGRDERHRRLARVLATWLTPAFALTVTFGIVPLLFLQALYGHLFYSSSVLVAWPWLAVPLLVMLAYYLAYAHDLGFERLRPAGRAVVAFTGVALLLFVAAIYVSNVTLMHHPEAFRDLYFADPGGARLWFGDGQAPPRYLHMVFGAVATAALLVAWLGQRAQRRGDEAWGAWAKRRGVLWFLVATIVEVGLGFWFLAALPSDLMLAFMGRDALATALLVVAVVLAFGMIGHAAMAANRNLAPLLGMYVVTLLVMVWLRDLVRERMLAPGFRIDGLDSEPQWALVALFGATLVAGLGVLLVVLRRAAREWRGPESPAPHDP